MGLMSPWTGTITFEGWDVSRLPAYAKAEMGLTLVPEGRQLFTDMSVFENLEMGATNKRARPNSRKNLERVYSMFPRLKERSAQKAGTLSGGEQQMLAVARGIMAEPAILIIDELSLGLAPVLVLQLFESLKQCVRRASPSCLWNKISNWPLPSVILDTYYPRAGVNWKDQRVN
jgi:branched-chain amino acid transport system ATP-binding protein